MLAVSSYATKTCSRCPFLLDAYATWGVLAGVASALTLAALAGTAMAVFLLWRSRNDLREVEAAERFEAAHLSRVVQRYVPIELRTRVINEEIAIAKQVIAMRRPRWRRLAILSGMIMLCGATTAYVSDHRNRTALAAARSAAKPALNLDVLKTVQGVWGWRVDSVQSCQENPQTITVTPDRKKLTVRYAKPFYNGPRPTTRLDFDVISARPDMLVMSLQEAADTAPSRTLQVTVQFLDADTFSIARSDEPMKTSGAIIRCPPQPVVNENVAR